MANGLAMPIMDKDVLAAGYNSVSIIRWLGSSDIIGHPCEIYIKAVTYMTCSPHMLYVNDYWNRSMRGTAVTAAWIASCSKGHCHPAFLLLASAYWGCHPHRREDSGKYVIHSPATCLSLPSSSFLPKSFVHPHVFGSAHMFLAGATLLCWDHRLHMSLHQDRYVAIAG